MILRLRNLVFGTARVTTMCIAFGAATATDLHAVPPCAHDREWQQLVVAHVARYPKMEVADVYKLLHQATMGSEHAAPSRAAAQSWMTSELRTMGDGPAEPIVDTLGHNQRVVRVHLRPFVAAHGNVDELVNDFLKTATQVRPDTSELRCAMNASIQLAQRKQVPFDATALQTLTTERGNAGFPASHHSESFEKSYKPAYRVVSRDLAATLLAHVKPATHK